MTIVSALLLAMLSAEPAPAAAVAPAPAAAKTKAKAKSGDPVRTPPVASLPTVEGEIVEVDQRGHRLRLRTSAGEVQLTFDRNTLVFGSSGAATTADLTLGAKVTAGRDGEARAAWVEVGPPASTPAAAP